MREDVIDLALASLSTLPAPKAPIPLQIRYVIGNEGCERFSFHGRRNILTVFSGHVAAHIFAGDRSGERGEGCVPYLCRQRLLFAFVLDSK
jgi:hypothetical protein